MNRLLRRVAVLMLLLIFAGCSSLKGTAVERFGNGVLNTVGLGGSKESFSTGETLVQSARVMTPEEEYYLGRAVSARILSIYKPSQDTVLLNYVNQIGLAAAAFSKHPETFGGYHFMVLDSQDINALSAPGGFVFITLGLLRTLPDEDALAGVLGHEISHIVNRDGVNAITPDKLSDALGKLDKVPPGSLSCGEVFLQAAALFSGAVDEVVGTLLEKGYSRDQEYAADRGSAEILKASGYDPFALLEALRRLDQAAKSGKVQLKKGWFATHPAPDDRLSHLTAYYEKEGIQQNSTNTALRTARFKKLAGQP